MFGGFPEVYCFVIPLPVLEYLEVYVSPLICVFKLATVFDLWRGI